jgi:uncharacterized repeat protein (TIGR03803 family)
MNSSKPNPAARNRWSVVAVVFVSALVVVMVQAAAGQTLTTLYSFSGGEDGGSPNPVVVDGQGNLYGTTCFGGVFDCNRSTIDCGTAFELTPTGTKTVLHSFGARFRYPGWTMERPQPVWFSVRKAIFTVRPGAAAHTERRPAMADCWTRGTTSEPEDAIEIELYRSAEALGHPRTRAESKSKTAGKSARSTRTRDVLAAPRTADFATLLVLFVTGLNYWAHPAVWLISGEGQPMRTSIPSGPQMPTS